MRKRRPEGVLGSRVPTAVISSPDGGRDKLMDYDDNDFQSQNFHLVGEDASKFPPSLRSFTLPKYDLDDNLQVHLGFGIDETEVLLGIQSQQDNHWIEDFSRGSSGIEFSSSAAESCSISRRNNVWSEATSSESVEMLLKSVGQDEAITKQIIIEEPVASEGHDSLNNQMDSSTDKDQLLPTTTGDLIDTGPTVPPDKCMESVQNPCDGLDTFKSQLDDKDISNQTTAGGFADTSLTAPSDRNATSLPETGCVVPGHHLQSDNTSHAEDNESVPQTTVNNDQVASMEYTLESPKLTSLVICENDGSTEEKTEDDHSSGPSKMITDNPENFTTENVQIDSSSSSPPSQDAGCAELDKQKFQLQAEGPSGVLICDKSDTSVSNDAVGEKHALTDQLDNNPDPVESEVYEKNVVKDDPSEGNTEGDGKFQETPAGDLEIVVSVKSPDVMKIVDSQHDPEVSSSVIEDKQAFKGDKGSQFTSVVKVYSPADLIQTTGDASKVKVSNNNFGTHAAEFTSQHLESNAAVKKVIQSDPLVTSDSSILDKPLPVTTTEMEMSAEPVGNEIKKVDSSTQKNSEPNTLDEDAKTMPVEVQGLLPDAEVAEKSGDVKESKVSSELDVGCPLNSKTSTHAETTENKEPKLSSLPAPDVVDFNRKETSVDEVSGSSSEVISKGVTVLKSCSVAELPSDIFTGAPSRELTGSTDESHLSQSTSKAQEYQKEVSEDSTGPVVAVQSNNVLETLPCVGRVASSDVHLQSITSSLDASCHDNDQRVSAKGDGGSTVSSGDDSGGQVHASSEGDIANKYDEKSANLLNENVTVPDALNCPESAEAECGSPTIISSNEQSHIEKEHQEDSVRSIDSNASVGNDPCWVAASINQQPDISKSTSVDLSPEVDKSFTFEVGPLTNLSERETSKAWKPFPSAESFDVAQAQDVMVGSSARSKTTTVMSQDGQSGSKETPDECKVPESAAKVSGMDKRSGSSSSKGTSTKGKSAKETSSRKQKTEKDPKLSITPSNSAGAISRALQVEEVRLYPYNEGIAAKPSNIPTVQASNLPDLNSSASPILFHQPFTDLQQVQLRAQIFVYGSLIQGTAPDETFMVSAFGDGGRSMWESTWRISIERLQREKSPLCNIETPLSSRPGTRISEQVSRSETLPSKPQNAPTRSASKVGISSPLLNPIISSSSPLWNLTTPSRDALQSGNLPRGSILETYPSLPSLNPYQSPQMRQYMGNTTPWLSQATGIGSPWLVSPQTSSLDAGQQYSALSIAEAVQVTPARETSVLHTSSMQQAPPGQLPPIVGPTNMTSCPAVLMDMEKTPTSSSSKHASAEQKSRKRKKNPSPLELVQIPTSTQSRAEQTPVSSVNKHLTVSAGVMSSLQAITSRVSAGNFVATVTSGVSSSQVQAVGGWDAGKKVNFPEDTSKSVEQAKLLAGDAASHAEAAVKHCQLVWSELAHQKNSGLIKEVEAQLASASVAAAAAVSVAKAAAAAAKVASDAALQAKLMVDDALGIGTSAQGYDSVSSDGSRMTPSSTLKGKDKGNHSSSIIVAAREAARRRVEAASAAARRAENLDAVVKAAEIAAEAVAEAGTIIAMGDPVPLRLKELLESGPDGYWKLHQISGENRGEHSISNIDEGGSGRTSQKFDDEREPLSKEMSRQPGENFKGQVNGLHRVPVGSEKGLEGPKGRKVYELAKTIGVVPESETGSGVGTSLIAGNDECDRDQPAEGSKGCGIEEGSVVEVVSYENEVRGAWYSAKVLTVKDGKAFVCYDERFVEEGSDHLKEWVPLQGEGDRPPRIRIPHPMTAIIKSEGTRKRRRAATGIHTWSVGDRVDVWMRNGWWEAVVTEKDREDDTKITVQFSGDGQSSSVRVWNLRPSLEWDNHLWVECSNERHHFSIEGDAPQEKRQKLGRHEGGMNSQGVNRSDEILGKDISVDDSRKTGQSWSRMLTEKDKMFTVGKGVVEENNSDALKVKRIGLQTEGSKVIFGVPKPGKKRKFMEVSKHYVADRVPSKPGDGTDSMKFAKYLMPQGPGRGWKSAPKVDFRGKQPPASKPKVLRSGKAHTTQNKTATEKDNPLVSSDPDPLQNAKSSDCLEDNNVVSQNLLEVGSVPAGVLVPANAPASKKKSSSAADADKGMKGKLGPVVKSARDDEKFATVHDHHPAKTMTDAVEPRRSNRRIQPTSRLLEGLQSSSLIVAKMPPVSHEKGTKARQKNALSSKGNNQG
ncbi:hypothetical protein H6P81_005181 [Aristolochia fimbriata]|uniref:Agenet domain-containing protein n=1 Tax=Aristolochia fimbriata TaxID=158543 RepID=A0AAV7EX96_ARIFI|nr:hypothetical protein H6P81_005181 [Aristolochia fimbriata]